MCYSETVQVGARGFFIVANGHKQNTSCGQMPRVHVDEDPASRPGQPLANMDAGPLLLAPKE